MSSAPTLISLEEYLSTSYHPDADFVDGEIEERNVGEQTHSFIQNFMAYLCTHHAEQWLAESRTEQRIRIGSSRIRVADIAILSSDAPWEEIITTPPIACIEVMSPEDRLPRAEKVLADYFTLGVPNIWLIDPYKRKAYTYTASGLQEIPATILVATNSPIRIDLTDLFTKLDKKKAVRLP